MSAHHDEQQELENAKHLWKSGGKWIFALLVAAALGYLGKVVYDNHLESKNAEAASIAAKVGGDVSKLAAVQQQYPQSTAAAQASLETGAALFQQNKLDEAVKAYRWVLDNNKTPLFQAAAAQNLANVLLQQKKYDEALAVLNTPVDDAFQPIINEAKGDVFAAQGKAKEASDAYKLALDKLPENAANRELLQLKMGSL